MTSKSLGVPSGPQDAPASSSWPCRSEESHFGGSKGEGCLEADGWLKTWCWVRAGANHGGPRTSRVAQPPFYPHRLGRYPAILLSLLELIIFGFGTAFVKSFHQYLFFRFLVSQAVVGYSTSSLSLSEWGAGGWGWIQPSELLMELWPSWAGSRSLEMLENLYPSSSWYPTYLFPHAPCYTLLPMTYSY